MTYSKNILKAHGLLSTDDLINGCDWYLDAKQFCTTISEKYSIDFLKVAGIVSALSPACNWEQNKKDAESFIMHLKYLSDYIPVVCTYGNNAYKSEIIFNSNGNKNDIATILLGKSGYKTKSFFLNMIGEFNEVTIDRHILKAVNFKEKCLTKKRYYSLVTEFKKVAEKVRISPMDLQAAIWVNYKRLNTI
jgi:hypothetical protein